MPLITRSKTECYLLTGWVFYDRKSYLLLDLTKYAPALRERVSLVAQGQLWGLVAQIRDCLFNLDFPRRCRLIFVYETLVFI